MASNARSSTDSHIELQRVMGNEQPLDSVVTGDAAPSSAAGSSPQHPEFTSTAEQPKHLVPREDASEGFSGPPSSKSPLEETQSRYTAIDDSASEGGSDSGDERVWEDDYGPYSNRDHALDIQNSTDPDSNDYWGLDGGTSTGREEGHDGIGSCLGSVMSGFVSMADCFTKGGK